MKWTDIRRFHKDLYIESTDDGIRIICFPAFFGNEEVSLTQEDHIANDEKYASSSTDVSTMRCVEFSSDQEISSICEVLSNAFKKHQIEAPEQPAEAREFMSELSEELDQLDPTAMSEHWNKVSEAMSDTASLELRKRLNVRRNLRKRFRLAKKI